MDNFEIRNGESKIIKVLLAEENWSDSHLLWEMLETASDLTYNVVSVEELSEHAEMLTEREIDVVFMNLEMPDNTSFETLRKVCDKAHDIPVIVVSSETDQKHVVNSFDAGAEDYLIKSNLDADILLTSITGTVKRYHLHKKLESSELRFRTLIEQFVDAIIVVDMDGNILFTNPAADDFLERGDKSLIGSPFGFPIVNESTEIEIVLPSGKTVTAELRVVKTKWEGQSADLISLRDITKRKQAAEALLEKEKIQVTFDTMKRILVTLSHHINNATTVIKGNAEINLSGEINADHEKSFKDILRQTNRISGVIKALGKMSKGVNLKTVDYVNIPDGMYDIDEELERLTNEIKVK